MASPFLNVICCVTAIDDDLVFVLLIAKGKGRIYFPPVINYPSIFFLSWDWLLGERFFRLPLMGLGGFSYLVFVVHLYRQAQIILSSFPSCPRC